MVCALLISATSRKNNSHPSGRSLTTLIPVPPGFSLVWVNAVWLPRIENDPPHTILGIARGLGCASAPAIRASIIEDPDVARITPPKEAGGEGGTWSPYLLRGRISRKDSELLLSYVGSEEEIMTSDFVHEQIGFDTATMENLEVDTFNGPTRLPYVESELLHRIPEMNSTERCQCVPRFGLAERDAWESMPRTDFDGLGLAMKTLISDDLVLYLIPYHSCPHFYRLQDPQSWMRGPDGLIDKVGFHLGRFWDPWDTKSVPLWERVFGDALIPGMPPDTANEI